VRLHVQLYVNKDRAATAALVRGLRSAGYGGLMLTVDAAIAGNRERDRRAQGVPTAAQGPAHGVQGTGAGAGVAHAISGYQDPDVAWEDIAWLRTLTDLPLYLKGIQCVEVRRGGSYGRTRHRTALTGTVRTRWRRLTSTTCRASCCRTTAGAHWTSASLRHLTCH
jgi:isopentenyl diphosphate isomerase/L-lactate dehydrogenase-like FMN-dependent dehydrogenase